MKEPNRFLLLVIHNIIRFLIWSFYKIFFGFRVEGIENLPKKGGLIIMPNHGSYFDPPAAGIVNFKRVCRFMARDTLFKNPVMGWLLPYLGAFPVKRGKVDRDSWSKFIELVHTGSAVVFFPEGTRTETGEIQEGKVGSGMLVYQSKAQVMPVYIHGAYKAWPKGGKMKFFTPITVVYGRVLSFDDCFAKPEGRETYEEITCRIINEIRRMKAEYIEKLDLKK
jgi:1-acyl-sn-glycerol-3-phosphate acyltransferase